MGVLALTVALLTSRTGTSEAAPAGAEVGDIDVVKMNGGVELTVVGTASSGMPGCGRLRAAYAQQGTELTVQIQRGPFALMCNGDAIPTAARVRVPTADLRVAEAIVAYQDGVELGGVYYPSLSPKCVWSRVGGLLRCG